MSNERPGAKNDSIDRKLVAILFADIAGYTAVMQQDEPKARRFIRIFNDRVNESVGAHSGEVIQFYGDGCICIFGSAVKALDCARKMQTAFRGKGVPVRIGVHSGDAYFEGNNVYGDSVNIASRIESVAMPGAVLFSERVMKDISNQPELKYSLLGSVEFKNVDEPMSVYALNVPGLVVPDSIDPSGKVRQPSRSTSGTMKKGLSMAVWLAIIGLIVVSSWDSIKGMFFGNNGADAEKTVAVLDFESISSNDELSVIASIATSRIVHGISQHNLARVVTGEVIENYRNVMKSNMIPVSDIEFLNQEMDVSVVFKGVVIANGDEILLECTVLDAETNEVIQGLRTIKGSVSDPMPAIEEQRELILGYLAQTEEKELNLSLETQPPKYAAYKELLKAKKLSNDAEAMGHILRAIEIDPNYFEPKVFLVSNYYNQDMYSEADSVLSAISDNLPDSEPRQRNLIIFYKALLEGKNDIAFQCVRDELEFAPFDLSTNQTVMVLGTQHTRNLDEAMKVYQMIPEDKLDLTDCVACQIRMYVKGYIELDQGRTKEAIGTGLTLLRNNGEYWSRDILIRGYAREKNWEELDAVIAQLNTGRNHMETAEIYLRAAAESYVIGATERAEGYAHAAATELGDTVDARLVEALWLTGDTTAAIKAGLSYLKIEPESWRTSTILIANALIVGDSLVANELIDDLEAQRTEYQYGGIDYALARAYAIAGRDSEALAYLKSAVQQGKWNNYDQFQYDIAFVNTRKLDAFDKICNYWSAE